jgi:predicted Na+-dependent transporter
MTKILPEALRNPRRFLLVLGAQIIIAVIFGFAYEDLGRHENRSSITIALQLLIPLCVGLAQGQYIYRWVRSLDDSQQLIQLEAWSCSAFGTVIFAGTVVLLQRAGVLDSLHCIGFGMIPTMTFLHLFFCVMLQQRHKSQSKVN